MMTIHEDNIMLTMHWKSSFLTVSRDYLNQSCSTFTLRLMPTKLVDSKNSSIVQRQSGSYSGTEQSLKEIFNFFIMDQDQGLGFDKSLWDKETK